MRKALLICTLFFCTLGTFAQQGVFWFRTTEFAWMYKTEYGTWSDWCAWEKSSLKVKIDMVKDQVVIYSGKVQVYNVLDVEEPPVDSSGGQQVKYFIVDQDDDFGYLRLRIEKNGNTQIYIDFSDLRWVYNVKRLGVD